MSLLLTIQSAHRGLKVASEGINVVGHNTANATTEGYNRRSLIATNMHPLQRGGHWIGQGARTKAFQRHVDVLVEQQIVQSYGDQSNAREAFQTMRLLEAHLADGSAYSIVESYDNFINSLRQLSDDPGDAIFRDQVVDDAERFTTSVQNTARFIDSAMINIREGIENSIDDMNDAIRSIAEFNKRIRADSGTMGNSDLMDQRDQIIAELSQLIGVKVHYESNGQATVFLNNHPVVQENNFRDISYSQDSNGRPLLQLETNSGFVDVTDGLSGQLGGKIAAYDVKQEFLDDLDTFVTDFSTQFNTQHALGYDQFANAGGDFFAFSTVSPSSSFEVDPNILSDVSLIAAAAGTDSDGDGVVDSAEYGDRGNLDSLIAIDEVALFGGGSYTPGQFLTHIYSKVAREVASAESNFDMQSIRMDDMFELRASISGVDMDQEAMKLMEYQASYEAAARVLSASNQLLGELMNIA